MKNLSGQSKIILIVDDEKDIRESVKIIFEDAGFNVITAENGKDMLNKLKKARPDLILLDILMPGLTTKEIFKELDKRKISIPVIFLTVARLSEELKQVNQKVLDYIEKPFDNEDLIKRVKVALK